MNEPTLKDIQDMSKTIENLGLGGDQHELFVKGLFMAERDIQDKETLDKLYHAYYTHDISLLNDLILSNE